MKKTESKPPPPLVLGVETSCDDTACAVLDGEGRVLSSVVSSQLAAHRPYGGVVPEIASREHLENWPRVSEEALELAGVELEQIDLIAATRGPGLVGSLLVGLSLGKSLAYALKLPLFAVNHLEGHLYSPFLCSPSLGSTVLGSAVPVPEGISGTADTPPGRFTGLVVSGGHSALLEIENEEVSTLSQTRDDAMGEAFDKIGKRIGLPFPGGSRVDELAERGDALAHPMSVPSCGPSLDFSYSGLKSQALLAIDRLEPPVSPVLPDETRPRDEESVTASWPQPLLDLLAGFRSAAVAQILDRIDRLHHSQAIELLAVSGGVAANRLLRRELERWASETRVPLRLVALEYSGDNAAMIAHAALCRFKHGSTGDPLDVEASSRLPFSAERNR